MATTSPPQASAAAVQVHTPFEDAQACFLCDYGDSRQLSEQLLRIAEAPALLEQRRAGLRTLRYEAWDTAMARVIAECASLQP